MGIVNKCCLTCALRSRHTGGASGFDIAREGVQFILFSPAFATTKRVR